MLKSFHAYSEIKAARVIMDFVDDVCHLMMMLMIMLMMMLMMMLIIITFNEGFTPFYNYLFPALVLLHLRRPFLAMI